MSCGNDIIEALGLTYSDETTVDLLLDKLNKVEGKSLTLLRGIVGSDAFLRRSGR